MYYTIRIHCKMSCVIKSDFRGIKILIFVDLYILSKKSYIKYNSCDYSSFYIYISKESVTKFTLLKVPNIYPHCTFIKAVWIGFKPYKNKQR